MQADPISRFLGFDPSAGVLPDVQEAQVAPSLPEGLAKDVTLTEALARDPRTVLLWALRALWYKAQATKHPHGPYAVVREASAWALREIAHEFRDRLGGWIVGKRDDHHK